MLYFLQIKERQGIFFLENEKSENDSNAIKSLKCMMQMNFILSKKIDFSVIVEREFKTTQTKT